MEYRSLHLALIGGAVLMIAAAQIHTASAQNPPPPPAAEAPPGAPPPPPATRGPSMRVACGPDLASFCPGLKGAEARKCLRAHRAEIAPPCEAYFKARRAAARAKAMSAPPPGSPPPAGPPPAGTDQH
jgi:hypothetical protein